MNRTLENSGTLAHAQMEIETLKGNKIEFK